MTEQGDYQGSVGEKWMLHSGTRMVIGTRIVISSI